MKTMPPWSRFVSTQPQRVTSWPICSVRNWPQVWVRSKAKLPAQHFEGKQFAAMATAAQRADRHCIRRAVSGKVRLRRDAFIAERDQHLRRNRHGRYFANPLECEALRDPQCLALLQLGH